MITAKNARPTGQGHRAVPVCRQLGRQGLHTRGNFEGFMLAARQKKWLEVHGIEHWTHFYTDYGAKCRSASYESLFEG